MEFEEFTVGECKRTLPVFKDDYQKVCTELKSISKRLLELLPDPSIGPEERLERIARIVPASIMISQHHRTARSKLNYLKSRIDELLPDEMGSCEEKLEILVNRINDLSPALKDRPLFEKLEKMGDNRASDIGR